MSRTGDLSNESLVLPIPDMAAEALPVGRLAGSPAHRRDRIKIQLDVITCQC